MTNNLIPKTSGVTDEEYYKAVEKPMIRYPPYEDVFRNVRWYKLMYFIFTGLAFATIICFAIFENYKFLYLGLGFCAIALVDIMIVIIKGGIK